MRVCLYVCVCVSAELCIHVQFDCSNNYSKGALWRLFSSVLKSEIPTEGAIMVGHWTGLANSGCCYERMFMGVKGHTIQEVRINPGVRLALITNASFKCHFHESKRSGSDLIIYQKQCSQWPMDLPQVLLLKSPPLPMISPGDQVCNTGTWVWRIMSNIQFGSSDSCVSHESVPIFILV